MPSPDGKIRYAVVAGGSISQGAFMPGVGQTENCVMTALVTGDPLKREKLARQYGLKSYAYEEYPALLSSGEIDAVYIATPNFLHREYVIPALEAGIHVLLEKPMAAAEEDCNAMLEAAAASTAKMMIAYRLHCEPGTVEMIERVQAGDFGDPRVFTSTFTQTVKRTNHRMQHGFAAGPALDMGPYPLNMVRQLFGDEPIEVSATGTTTPGSELDTFDTVTVVLRFPQERLAQFTVSYSLPSSERFQLIGTKGEIEASPCFGFGEGVGITYRATIGGNTKEHSHPVVDQFAGETAYFSDCIINDVAPEPDAEEGWRDVRILAAVERSLASGQIQTLEPLPPKRVPINGQQRHYPLAKAPGLISTESPTE
jgi:predicted dehydrogenase